MFGAESQTLRRPVAAIYAGFGAYSLKHVDGFSFFNNPAALSQIKNVQAGIYAERRFMLSELNYYTGAVTIPAGSGNFGMKTGYSGFNDYNETQIGVAYGRSLGSKLDAGLQINYNGIRINSYGTASAISFELGTVWHLTEKLHTGLHVKNPVGGKFGKNQEEQLPAVYTFGIGFDASEKLLVSAEIVKEKDHEVTVNAGFQYRFVSMLMIRAGIASVSSTGWLGVGLNLRSLRLDITASYHPQLGISPGLLLLFMFNNNDQ
jgi:hypothetical protein